MEVSCQRLHDWANSLPSFRFDFDQEQIPVNGLYLLFEEGETAHGAKRIVRVGTHTGQNQLRSRLKQHFLTQNKDRSIFRKNIGRALLNKAQDDFLDKWEIDLTAKAARQQHGSGIDANYQQAIEQQVTTYMQTHFSFVVVSIEDKEERLNLESKIISTVSSCSECGSSKSWLGSFSPKDKIKASGLWLVNELYKQPLTEKDFDRLQKLTRIQ